MKSKKYLDKSLPEGNGYRAKTRFARFYNLPELMAMFKEVADIQTADMLKLPVPEAHYHNVAVKPSEIQKDLVASLSDRAEKVRNGMVNATEDNMLLITNDGRKLALDQRLTNDMLPDFEGSKINACVDNIVRIWEDTAEKKSAQLVFCDLSTPKSRLPWCPAVQAPEGRRWIRQCPPPVPPRNLRIPQESGCWHPHEVRKGL